MGVTPDEFYDEARVAVVPMGFCFPGQDETGADLPPRPECGRLWHQRLFALLPSLELIILAGIYAQRWHLEAPGLRLTATVADWRRYLEEPAPRRYLPLPHPSWRNNGWLRKNPWFEAELVPVLRREVRRLLESGESKSFH
jgi:uracil-DNA glycosylase